MLVLPLRKYIIIFPFLELMSQWKSKILGYITCRLLQHNGNREAERADQGSVPVNVLVVSVDLFLYMDCGCSCFLYVFYRERRCLLYIENQCSRLLWCKRKVIFISQLLCGCMCFLQSKPICICLCVDVFVSHGVSIYVCYTWCVVVFFSYGVTVYVYVICGV